MANESFPTGTYVYLDIEGYDAKAEAKAELADPRPMDLMAYIRAWVSKVITYSSAGKSYNPGVYCHAKNAWDISRAVSHALAGTNVRARFWLVGGGHFCLKWDPATGDQGWKDPDGRGWYPADAWQNPYATVEETHEGVKLEIDQNVSRLPDPAAPPEIPEITT